MDRQILKVARNIVRTKFVKATCILNKLESLIAKKCHDDDSFYLVAL